jgi:hypothetical protein
MKTKSSLIISAIFMLFAITNSFAQVNLTLQVSMLNESVHETGVHVAGDFQGWDPSATLLTDEDGDGIYSVTLAVNSNSTFQYKFVNGDYWGADEAVWGDCGAGNGNRTVSTGDTDLTLDAYSFGSCNIVVPEVEDVNLTLHVNMANEVVSADGVHVAGSFQAWDPAATEMTDEDGDNIYTVTLAVSPNSSYEYKFVNGNSWDSDETIAGDCTTGNRTVETVEEDLSLSVVCYASCSACPIYGCIDITAVNYNPEADTDDNSCSYASGCTDETAINFDEGATVDDASCIYPVAVTFQADMTHEEVSDEGIHIAGAFQNWDPSATELLDEDADNIYSIVLSLDPNSTYEYKFVNGASWDGGENLDANCGAANRSITTSTEDLSLPVVCYASCTACPIYGCTDAIAVNYDELADTDDNSCSYASGCIDESALNFDEGALVDDASCIYPVAVTFQVNMANEEVSDEGIHIAGAFQNWDPSATQLLDVDADNIYTVVLSLDPNSTYEYKFVNGTSWDGAENVNADCAVNGNRSIATLSADTVLSVVCFTSCSACPIYGCTDATAINYNELADTDDASCSYAEGCIDESALNYDSGAIVNDGSCEYPIYITLQVDMTQQEVAADGIHLAGSFQGWDPAVTEMTDDDADNIYSITLTLNLNSTYEYKFINGTSWDGAENIDADCATDGNRSLTTIATDSVYAPVCFTSCSACEEIVMYDVTLKVGMTNTEVSADGVHVAGSFQGWDPSATELSDEDGDGIYEVTLSVEAGVYDYKFINGNSWDADNESVPGSCNVNGNRQVDVMSDMTVQYCYNQCDEECIPYPEAAEITFAVNMQSVAIDASGVWLMGSFTDSQWQGGRIQMTEDANVAGVYVATVLVDGPAEIQYKFSNGEPISGTAFEHGENFDFETSGCGASNGIGGWNRMFVRSGEAEHAGAFCYESCELCPGNPGPTSQELIFDEGWSIFSTYISADDMNVISLLEPVYDNIVIAKNYLGHAYLPEWNFNAIGDVLIGQGYQIKTTQASSITIEGTYMQPEENPINLTAGWNMIGYLRLEPANAGLILADMSASGNLVIAKDYLGNAYLPEWEFNGIGDMEPGRGYQMKVLEDDVLQYLSNDETYRHSSKKVVANKTIHFPKANVTGNNMQMVIPNASWDILPNEGDEIAAFDKSGTLIGSAIYFNPVTVVTLWGDDATTEVKDGLLNAEIPSFKLWDSRVNEERTIEVSVSYQIDALSVISNIVNVKNTKDGISLFNAVPNPTNEVTTISFFIPKQAKVKIYIFNVLGEFVDVVTDATFEEGYHNVEVNASKFEAGTYFFKMMSGDLRYVKNIVVLE